MDPACVHARRARRLLRVQRLLIGAAALVIVPIASCYVDQWRPWDKNLQLIRQPRAAIEGALLRETPLGSSMAEVRAVIVRKHWSLSRYTRSDTAITAQLGEYSSFLLSMGVWATWKFNPDGKLVEVTIVKELDGP